MVKREKTEQWESMKGMDRKGEKTMKTFDLINAQAQFVEPDNEISHINTRLHLIRNLGVLSLDWDQWIFHRMKKTPGSRVLDLGCGSGSFWLHNREQIPPDWEITLTDCSPAMLKEAHHCLSDGRRHFAFQLLDLRDIPFEDGRFDLLIANFLLPQVPDHTHIFSEIRRVLQPDGLFYAATVSEHTFDTLNALLDAAGLPPWASVGAFSLENGADQIAGWFTEVELHQLTTSLAVREAEPLLQCLRSGIPQDQHNEAAFQRLSELVQQELSRYGEISLALDIGLFEAANRIE